MNIEGIDVWYVFPALITGMYYMLEFFGWPHQGPGRKTVKPIFEMTGPKPIDVQWWALRNKSADAELQRVALRTQRDVLRALYEEQMRASANRPTPIDLGPVGVERRMSILGQMLGHNGVQLEPQGGALLITMGTNHIRIPTPAPGYLIPQVASAINRLQMAEQNTLAGAIGGAAGVLGGMFGGGRGDTPSHIGGGWAPGHACGDVRVPRPPLLTKEPPWSNP